MLWRVQPKCVCCPCQKDFKPLSHAAGHRAWISTRLAPTLPAKSRRG